MTNPVSPEWKLFHFFWSNVQGDNDESYSPHDLPVTR